MSAPRAPEPPVSIVARMNLAAMATADLIEMQRALIGRTPRGRRTVRSLLAAISDELASRADGVQ